ncbi:MAG: hypothetical protein ACKO5K_12740, partial [Armatimonadota bacterium]
ADPPGRRLDPPPRARYGDELGGWAYCGAWGDYSGVAVGRHWFLTAKHVGGHIGGVFVFQGKEHRAVARTEVGNADLVLWQVEGDLPTWAPLHSGLAGDRLRAVVVGRGLAPGEPVVAAGRRVGWTWGRADGRMSWGDGDLVGRATLSGGETVLIGAFTPQGCAVATGDSGGGVFVREGGRWALAGICRSTQRLWRRADDAGTTLVASLWDSRGFVPADSGGRVSSELLGRPSAWVASRVSDHAVRIRAVIGGRPGPDWHRFVTVLGAAVVFGGLTGARWMLRAARDRRRRLPTRRG